MGGEPACSAWRHQGPPQVGERCLPVASVWGEQVLGGAGPWRQCLGPPSGGHSAQTLLVLGGSVWADTASMTCFFLCIHKEAM